MLQESFPLQQGLKPPDIALSAAASCLQESFPLQQGLKRFLLIQSIAFPIASGVLSTTTRIETAIGLSCHEIFCLTLQESFPLQQGLKPLLCGRCY